MYCEISKTHNYGMHIAIATLHAMKFSWFTIQLALYHRKKSYISGIESVTEIPDFCMYISIVHEIPTF